MNNKELVILAGKKQGGGSVTPASIVTATGQMTSQQAADTLDNIGGEPEKLIVTVTQSGGVYSADKTYAEIEAAITDGKTVAARTEYEDFFLVGYGDSDEFVFYSLYPTTYDAPIISVISVFDDDSCTYYSFPVDKSPAIVTNLSSTSITLASAADNTIYEYGELTALTVTAITTTGDFIIRFTSGATPTTTSLPVSMKFPEAFVAESNMRYEINCSNGYAVAIGWPVS